MDDQLERPDDDLARTQRLVDALAHQIFNDMNRIDDEWNSLGIPPGGKNAQGEGQPLFALRRIGQINLAPYREIVAAHGGDLTGASHV